MENESYLTFHKIFTSKTKNFRFNNIAKILGYKNTIQSSWITYKFEDEKLENDYLEINFNLFKFTRLIIQIIYFFLTILRLILNNDFEKKNYLLTNLLFALFWITSFVLYLFSKTILSKKILNLILSLIVIIIQGYSCIGNESIYFMPYFQIRQINILFIFSIFEILFFFEANSLFTLLILFSDIFISILTIVLKSDSSYLVLYTRDSSGNTAVPGEKVGDTKNYFDILTCLFSISFAHLFKRKYSFFLRNIFLERKLFKDQFTYYNGIIDNMIGYQFTIKNKTILNFNQNLRKLIYYTFNLKQMEKQEIKGNSLIKKMRDKYGQYIFFDNNNNFNNNTAIKTVMNLPNLNPTSLNSLTNSLIPSNINNNINNINNLNNTINNNSTNIQNINIGHKNPDGNKRNSLQHNLIVNNRTGSFLNQHENLLIESLNNNNNNNNNYHSNNNSIGNLYFNKGIDAHINAETKNIKQNINNIGNMNINIKNYNSNEINLLLAANPNILLNTFPTSLMNFNKINDSDMNSKTNNIIINNLPNTASESYNNKGSIIYSIANKSDFNQSNNAFNNQTFQNTMMHYNSNIHNNNESANNLLMFNNINNPSNTSDFTLHNLNRKKDSASRCSDAKDTITKVMPNNTSNYINNNNNNINHSTNINNSNSNNIINLAKGNNQIENNHNIILNKNNRNVNSQNFQKTKSNESPLGYSINSLNNNSKKINYINLNNLNNNKNIFEFSNISNNPYLNNHSNLSSKLFNFNNSENIININQKPLNQGKLFDIQNNNNNGYNITNSRNNYNNCNFNNFTNNKNNKTNKKSTFYGNNKNSHDKEKKFYENIQNEFSIFSHFIEKYLKSLLPNFLDKNFVNYSCNDLLEFTEKIEKKFSYSNFPHYNKNIINEKYHKFNLLGEFYREEDKRHFQIYFRKLPEHHAIDFLMYDLTEIRDSQVTDLNSQNRLFEDLVHELKNPINLILSFIAKLGNINNTINSNFNMNMMQNYNEKTNSIVNVNPNAKPSKQIKSQNSLEAEKTTIASPANKLNNISNSQVNRQNSIGNSNINANNNYNKNNMFQNTVNSDSMNINIKENFFVHLENICNFILLYSENILDYCNINFYENKTKGLNEKLSNRNNFDLSKSAISGKSNLNSNNLTNPNNLLEKNTEVYNSDNESFLRSIEDRFKNRNRAYEFKNEKLNIREICDFCKNICSTLLLFKYKDNYEKIKVFCEFEELVDKKEIYSDIYKIKQILINFISNSLKFTKKGFIKIRSEIIEVEKKIKISVIDTGTGIDDKTLNTLMKDNLDIQKINKINRINEMIYKTPSYLTGYNSQTYLQVNYNSNVHLNNNNNNNNYTNNLSLNSKNNLGIFNNNNNSNNNNLINNNHSTHINNINNENNTNNLNTSNLNRTRTSLTQKTQKKESFTFKKMGIGIKICKFLSKKLNLNLTISSKVGSGSESSIFLSYEDERLGADSKSENANNTNKLGKLSSTINNVNSNLSSPKNKIIFFNKLKTNESINISENSNPNNNESKNEKNEDINFKNHKGGNLPEISLNNVKINCKINHSNSVKSLDALKNHLPPNKNKELSRVFIDKKSTIDKKLRFINNFKSDSNSPSNRNLNNEISNIEFAPLDSVNNPNKVFSPYDCSLEVDSSNFDEMESKMNKSHLNNDKFDNYNSDEPKSSDKKLKLKPYNSLKMLSKNSLFKSEAIKKDDLINKNDKRNNIQYLNFDMDINNFSQNNNNLSVSSLKNSGEKSTDKETNKLNQIKISRNMEILSEINLKHRTKDSNNSLSEFEIGKIPLFSFAFFFL